MTINCTKLRKYFTALLFAAAICFVLPLCQVRADVIFEPKEQDFDENGIIHGYLYGHYYINGPEGHATVYAGPYDDTELKTLQNGLRIELSTTYDDMNGMQWGVYEDGVIPMPYLVKEYDSDSFVAEYHSQLKYTENMSTLSADYRDKVICIYPYPGALTFDAMNMAEFNGSARYQLYFVDEEERIWGQMIFGFSDSKQWVCVTDPTARPFDLYPNGATPERNIDSDAYKLGRTVEPTEIYKPLPKPRDLDMLNTIVTNPASMIIIVAFIAIVVFGTVGIIFRIRIKKKTSEAVNTSEVSNSSDTVSDNTASDGTELNVSE